MIDVGDGIELMRDIVLKAQLILTDPPHMDRFADADAHWEFAHTWKRAARDLLDRTTGGTLIHSCGSLDVRELQNYLCDWKPDRILIWPHPGEVTFHYFLVHGSSPIEGVLEGLSKPDSLWAYLIEQHTQRGDLVLDPFCGRGEVPLSAITSGRRYRGRDIDADAVTACQRLWGL